MGGKSSKVQELENRVANLTVENEEWQRWIREEKPRLEKEANYYKKLYTTENLESLEQHRARVQSLRLGGSRLSSAIAYPECLNVGLFGFPGVGKTSLLNSLKFAVYGKLMAVDKEQAAPEYFQGGHTMRRLKVAITDHIQFIDNRGVSAGDLTHKGSERELINQLEGKSTFTSKVDWKGASQPKAARQEEKIYCSVLVFDARNPQTIFNVIRRFSDALFEWQGRYPLAILTHVDVAEEDEMKQMRLVLQTAGIEDYYEVANYTTSSPGLSEEHQISLLMFIERCVKDGERIYELRTAMESDDM